MRASKTSTDPGRQELRDALAAFKRAFGGAALMSGALNVLMLTGSFFMMLVYDTVLPSGSGSTLVSLVILVLIFYAFQGALDLLRSRVLVQIGAALDVTLSARVYRALTRLTLRMKPQADSLQPLRDLDAVRSFLSGAGPAAFFDLPWILLYLAIAFAFHWLLGITTLIGAAILVGITVLTEVNTREQTREVTTHASRRSGLAETNRQNAEVIHAMGMTGRMEEAWAGANRDYLRSQQTASEIGGRYLSITRVSRMALQSMVLAVGAYLVLRGEASAGVIIASSILVSRALAPVEQVIGSWRGFSAARQSWTRLAEMLAAFPPEDPRLRLPPPTERLSVEGLGIAPPGGSTLTVAGVSFALQAGQALGVIGPSGSGKSSLARGLVGVWPAVRGHVRLDGASLDQWDPELLGPHIGYLPQDVELLSGTVAQNIARFEDGASPEDVVAAAKQADVHDMILRLPQGYETEVGRSGAALSAGQRQRVALARALYKDPFLVVLDEPNSNLDAEGEQALTRSIMNVRARNGVVVVIAHRPSALAAVDMVMFMRDGSAAAFGPKDEVLAKVLQQSAPGPGVVEIRRG
jgi:PrtD family type I secretion system ABC transporter